MAIRVVCDCGKTYDVTEKHAGRTLKCPACGKGMEVPDATELPIVTDEDDPSDDDSAEPTMWMRVQGRLKNAVTPSRRYSKTGHKVADRILNASTPFEMEVLKGLDRGLDLLARIERATNTIRIIMLLPFFLAAFWVVFAVGVFFLGLIFAAINQSS